MRSGRRRSIGPGTRGWTRSPSGWRGAPNDRRRDAPVGPAELRLGGQRGERLTDRAELTSRGGAAIFSPRERRGVGVASAGLTMWGAPPHFFFWDGRVRVPRLRRLFPVPSDRKSTRLNSSHVSEYRMPS